MNPRLFASILASLTLIASAHAAEEGFVSLFNGTSLDGWEGNPALWSAKDGTITGQTREDTKLSHNTFLVWKGGTTEDFELRLSYRIVNGNSGIQYRSKLLPPGAQGPIVSGYQADFEAGKTYSGILYEERARGILAQRGQKVVVRPADGGKHKVDVVGSVGKSEEIQAAIKSEDWNDYVVVAKGNHLVHSINGHTTVDVTDEDAANAAKSGILALQIHQGPPMIVQFKNIRMKKLSGDAAANTGDIDSIQGEWIAVSGIRGGQALPADWLNSLHLKFKADKYEVAWLDGGDSGQVKLRTDASPKQMDISSDGAGPLQGIYELQDGIMKVAYGTDGAGRPKGFDSGNGSSVMAITYKKK